MSATTASVPRAVLGARVFPTVAKPPADPTRQPGCTPAEVCGLRTSGAAWTPGRVTADQAALWWSECLSGPAQAAPWCRPAPTGSRGMYCAAALSRVRRPTRRRRTVVTGRPHTSGTTQIISSSGPPPGPQGGMRRIRPRCAGSWSRSSSICASGNRPGSRAPPPGASRRTPACGHHRRRLRPRVRIDRKRPTHRRSRPPLPNRASGTAPPRLPESARKRTTPGEGSGRATMEQERA